MHESTWIGGIAVPGKVGTSDQPWAVSKIGEMVEYQWPVVTWRNFANQINHQRWPTGITDPCRSSRHNAKMRKILIPSWKQSHFDLHLHTTKDFSPWPDHDHGPAKSQIDFQNPSSISKGLDHGHMVRNMIERVKNDLIPDISLAG